MPTYEYRCAECGEVFERTEHIAEHEEAAAHRGAPLHCPRCNAEQVEQVFSSFFAKTARKS